MLSALIALLLSAQAPELAEQATPDPVLEPVAAPAKAPAVKVEGGATFDPRTQVVDGPALQVVIGERAVFHLDAKGAPVLDAVQQGPLAVAHPAGAAKETFAAPKAGQLAVALDGSPQKKASYLKVWNGLDHPVAYHAGILVFRADGVLHPQTVRVCAVPSGKSGVETWPVPVAAVAVANFTPAPAGGACK